MLRPKKCPNCGANGIDNISNAREMLDTFGFGGQDCKRWWCNNCNYNFDDGEAELTSWYKDKDFSKMTISQIADVIFDDWSDDISPTVLPYIEAMLNIEDINEMYGADPASNIVTYFLSNSKDWKTETAKEVKKALQIMLNKDSKTKK